MFKNQYQGGPFVEIFSAQGKNPGAKWKILGTPSAIWKEYDKELKGFVFILEGNSQINKMQLPKETRQTLGLIQQFLTLQIFVPLGKGFSTELLGDDDAADTNVSEARALYGENGTTIWCNMCIDLVAFTSELFRGAVFQSLDGIIISANCKLRKIFTLKSKPQNTAKEDGMCIVPSIPHEPTDVIPRSCRLNTDVPQVTQLLNLTNIHKPEIKCRDYPLQETGSLVNRGQGNTHSSKTQNVSHIAFGSKILGPPPSSTRRVSTGVTGEVTKTRGSRSNRSYRLQNSGMPTDSIQNIERLELSFSPFSDSLDQGGKRNTHQTTKDVYQNDPAIQTQETSVSGGADFQPTSPQVPLADKISHRGLSLKNAARSTWEITSGCFNHVPPFTCNSNYLTMKNMLSEEGATILNDNRQKNSALVSFFEGLVGIDQNKRSSVITMNDKWMFPESVTESVQLDRREEFVATEDSACHNLTSPQSASVEHHSSEAGDHQVNNEEIFRFSSSPRSVPHGRSPNMSPECCVFPLDLKPDSNGVHGKTQTADSFQGADSSEEDDNNELVHGTENLEISHCRQETSDSAVFKEIPLKKMSWRNEYWKNKEHSKQNLKESILCKPQSSTMRKTDSVSSQNILKPTPSLSPTLRKPKFFKVFRNESEKNERYEGVSDQLKRSISKTSPKKISKENSCLTAQTGEYDWKNYQSDRLSSSDLQMLASMKRQQNEELQDTGNSHGLGMSQMDNCNVSISTSSDDDTATWNSCFPPPVNQKHHYQKEMSPLSHSNPRDWLNVLSPLIIPGSQQLEEHTKSSTKQSTQGEDDLSAEEDFDSFI